MQITVLEIRGLNCSNGYGNFGLVAEGADPMKSDQIILKNNPLIPRNTTLMFAGFSPRIR